MNTKLTRREFLTPSPILIRLLLAIVIGWLVMTGFEAFRSFVVQGWLWFACLGLVAAVVCAMGWVGRKVYARLPARGKAVCDGVGAVVLALAFVYIGILAWHAFQAGDSAKGVFLAAMGCWSFARAMKREDEAPAEP